MKISALHIIFGSILSLSCRGQVTINPSSILTVSEGERANFTCTGSGPHLLQINSNVTTDRFILEDEGRTSEERTVEYYMNKTLREDNGTTLQCFFNGEGSMILTLVVNSEMDTVVDNKSSNIVPLKYHPANYIFRVIEGSSPHLLLKVKFASNNTQYNWTRNGLPITSDSHLSLHIDGLIFSGVSRGDSGVYVVQASDSTGYDEAIINVEVYYGPIFNEGSGIVNRTVIEGEDITLSCKFTSNPGYFFLAQYYRPADNLDVKDRDFEITNAVLGNTGKYRCNARNSVANRELVFNLIVIAQSTVPVPSVSPSSTPGSGADALGNVCSTLLFSILLIVGMVLTQ